MRQVTAVMTVTGAAAFVALLWTLDLSSVRTLVVGAGWGVALIVAQEIVAHGLNAVAWRLASDPRYARAVPLARLLELRIAGDAINYLTPTATLGGEVSRIGLLRGRYGVGVETGSVIVAKVAQTLAQALFVAVGVVFVLRVRLDVRSLTIGAAAGTLIVAVLLAALRLPVVRRMLHPPWRECAGFLRRRPCRVAAATGLFFAGYAWGIVEAYLICRCLGLDLGISTAFALETMSACLDGLLFMVPAKIGTQEGGKAAIFATLGLSPTAGFAFGLLRHARELAWAATGLVITALWCQRGRAVPASAGARQGEGSS